MSGKDDAPRLLGSLAELDPREDALVAVFAMLRSCREGLTAGGKPFVDLEVADQSGTVRGKIWDDAGKAIRAARELEPGRPAKLLCQAQYYQGNLQLNVKGIRSVVDDDPGYDAARVFGAGIDLCADLLCRTMVFDIETVPAFDKRSLPSTIAESLTKFADRKEMDTIMVMGLSPFFGKVVSLAVGEGEREANEGHVTVLAVPPEESTKDLPPWIRPVTEADLLRAFWTLASVAQTVVTYNGRGFDVPFLVARSLVLGVPARIDLLGNRYALRPHLDLYQVLSQGSYGGGPTNLDVVCWALGIESPKGQMDGSMVAPAYAQGQIQQIAEYNRQDVIATTKVYHRVRDGILRYRADW